MKNKHKNFSKLKWEMIEEVNTGGLDDNNIYRKKIRRSKVTGGWLVESEVYDQEAGFGVGLTFLPDPKYDWKPIKREKKE
ncbi:MAG: hypothetical protein ACNS62_04475 [Candidatus Cyclobacteriaceae bacterium M3_2C_046]